MAKIARHWTHERLAENLRAASHAQTLEAAALEWTLRDTGDIRNVRDARARQEIRCQLCSHVIYRYAVLENTANGMLLIIGLDCLTKLVAFLESGQIRAPLRSGSENHQRLSGLLDALRDEIEGTAELQSLLANKTVLGWFEQELDAQRLPEDIARLVRLVRLGILPTPADAECLVEFYKEQRLLPIEIVVPPFHLQALARFLPRLPALVPIAAQARLMRIAERTAALAAEHRKRRELAARRTWLSERLASFRRRGMLPSVIPDEALDRVGKLIDRDRPLAARLRLPDALAELDRLLEQLRREIPGSDWYLTTDVERLRGEVTAAADQPPSYTHEDLMRRVAEWDRIVRHQLASPTVCVYIDTRPGELMPIVFHRTDRDTWQHERWFIREGHRPSKSGAYTARLVNNQDLFALTETAEHGPSLAAMTLDTPLDRSPFGGRYRGQGGRDGDRWIIPTPRPLWRAGTYRCLILSTHDDHVLVYPLSRVRASRRPKP